MPGSVITGADPQAASLWFNLQRLDYQLSEIDKLQKEYREKYYPKSQKCTCPNQETNDGICQGGCAD